MTTTHSIAPVSGLPRARRIIPPGGQNIDGAPLETSHTVAAPRDELVVLGSTRLVIMLISYGLVDELRLMAYPLMLAGGKRPLEADGTLKRLCLTGSQPTTTGAILTTYSLDASPQ